MHPNKILVKYHYQTGESTSKLVLFNPNKKYEFTVPNSVSLMPKYGKMFLYGSNDGRTAGLAKIDPHMEATLLLDLKQCKLKNDHIYQQDGQTGNYGFRNWENYCYNEDVALFYKTRNTEFKEKMNETHKSMGACSLEELQASTAENKIYYY